MTIDVDLTLAKSLHIEERVAHLLEIERGAVVACMRRETERCARHLAKGRLCLLGTVWQRKTRPLTRSDDDIAIISRGGDRDIAYDAFEILYRPAEIDAPHALDNHREA